MKKTAIDLSSLSEAQRKMCVQLLAQGNIQFNPQGAGYQAVLKVPTKQLKQFSQHQNKHKSKQNRPCDKINIEKPISAKPVPKSMYLNGRKKLSRVTKLANLDKLQSLHSEIEIYIYPKRISLGGLQEVIQNVYETCWTIHKNGCRPEEISLHKIFHGLVCPKDGSKSKNDQNLVNILDTINHFQYKEIGVRFFYQFLSQKLDQDQFLYFLVLRALIVEMIGQIPVLPPKGWKSANVSHIEGLTKLKWNPSDTEIEEQICRDFLQISSLQQNNPSEQFQKLTEVMYFCEQKKANYIQFYELLHFMVRDFVKEVPSCQMQRLNLSYSRDDSTLNDLLFTSGPTLNEPQAPLQIEYMAEFKQQEPVEKDSLSIENKKKNFDDNFSKLVMEKVCEIMGKMKIQSYGVNKIQQKIQGCLQSIQEQEKMRWILVVELKGTASELRYIEQLQQQYIDLREDMEGNMMLMNSLVRRFINGPGLMTIICSQIQF